MKPKKLLTILLSSLLLLFVVQTLVFEVPVTDIFYAQAETDTSHTSPPVVDGNTAMYSALSGNPYTIADIAEQASPAIVYISVEWPTQTRESPTVDPFADLFDNWFFSPFPNQRTPMQPPTSQGTGFIIDSSGIILTNQHVVGNKDDQQTIIVTVNSGGEINDHEAVILGSDAKLDLAVLQIQSDRELPSVSLGDSEHSRPGEWVIAIGNPYGKQFEQTVTVGVLSAKGREINIRTDRGTTQVYSNLMQTDAAINRGNSGGPLLNIQGEVIGINTAVHAQAQGIGFAIPINVAKEVLQELIETGGVEHKLPPRAWLGILYGPITHDVLEHLKLPDTKGIMIGDVFENSPASESGLQAFDIVRRVDDLAIDNYKEFADIIRSKSPGEAVLLTVVRQDKTIFIRVTLGDMPVEYR